MVLAFKNRESKPETNIVKYQTRKKKKLAWHAISQKL